MDGDIERPGGGDSTTNAREGYAGGLLIGDVSCGFGDEHEGFF